MQTDFDTGNRKPNSVFINNILLYIALTWSLFQLYVSSPLVLEITPWMNADVVKRGPVSFPAVQEFSLQLNL